MSIEPSSIPHFTPLYLLDNFLLSLSATLNDTATATAAAATTTRSIEPNQNDDAEALDTQPKTKLLIQQQRLLLLEAADFLMGDSLLEGALTLLDSSTYTMIPAVRLIRAEPSGRCLFRVRSTCTSSSQSNHGKRRRSEGGYDSASEYLCLLGSPWPGSTAMDSRDEGEGTIVAAGRIGFYCTCRSFFERCKGDLNGTSFCKHLLASRLAPFLVDSSNHTKCYVEETVTDQEFADIMTSRLC